MEVVSGHQGVDPNLRKVRISINTKLLLVVAFFVLVPLSAYLFFALDLFKKDKTAYIFDSTLSTTSVLSRQVNDRIGEIIKNNFLISGLLTQGKNSEKYAQEIFESQKEIFELVIYKNQQKDALQAPDWVPVFERLKLEFLKEFNLDQNYILDLRKEFDLSKAILQGQKIHIQNQSTVGGIPHLSILLVVSDDQVLFSRMSLDGLFKVFGENKTFRNMLFTDTGELLIHPDSSLVLQRMNQADLPQVKSILSQELNSGVQELENHRGEPTLIAYTKIPNMRMIVVSEILKDDAFRSIKDLIFKSVVLAVCLMALAFMVALIVSRSFTGPIRLLMSGTQKIAQGDFETSLTIKSRDEIGVLSDSFNYMAAEILRYMGEVKEKARMENELAVAQLVQSSFFPEASLQLPSMEIYGHYVPASECGGDWYGVLSVGNKTLLFIGDATGHGVPAALVTATVNAGMNLIEEMCKMSPQLADRPQLIMKLLNKAVHDVGGQILMTFFLGIYDKTNGELHFSNASHNPPYIIRNNPDGATKEDVEVLEVSPGPRFGHQENATYASNKISLRPGDLLILTTDGILEAENPEGKQFGERRFIKSILSTSSQSSQQIVDKLMEDAYNFYDGVPPNDDVTLVVAKTL